jgi:hypothetical protein
MRGPLFQRRRRPGATTRWHDKRFGVPAAHGPAAAVADSCRHHSITCRLRRKYSFSPNGFIVGGEGWGEGRRIALPRRFANVARFPLTQPSPPCQHGGEGFVSVVAKSLASLSNFVSRLRRKYSFSPNGIAGWTLGFV